MFASTVSFGHYLIRIQGFTIEIEGVNGKEFLPELINYYKNIKNLKIKYTKQVNKILTTFR